MTENLDENKKKIYESLTEYFKSKEKQKFVPGKTKIKYGGEVLDQEEVFAVVDSILNGWFGLAEKGDEFEKELARFVGTKYSLLTNSGSSANLLAISSLTSPNIKDRAKPGDEVIATPLNFPTIFTGIVNNGLKPVLVDVELGTYNLDTSVLGNAVSERTKIIIAQHTMGIPNDMDVIGELVEKNNLNLIEDSCEALGATFDGRMLGSFGKFGSFSFYVPHHITLGEGGALTSNEIELVATAKSIRDGGINLWCGICKKMLDTRLDCPHKFVPTSKELPEDYHRNFEFINLGQKLRPVEFQAAMGVIQLKRLNDFIKSRRENFDVLNNGLKEFEEFFILPSWPKKAEPSWFAYPITIRDGVGFKRKDIVEWLNKNNIETRPLLAGNILRHPIAKNIDFRVIGKTENSDKITRDSFYLGVYPGLDKEKLDFVLNVFEDFLRNRK
jgi:CDP-6-deoxy-D-xylo-4-hexulose-3-dehydrase